MNLPTSKPPALIGVFPEILSRGGVQRLSDHVAQVMVRLADDRGLACEILTLSDPTGLHECPAADGGANGSSGYTLRGFGGSRCRLSWHLWRRAKAARVVFFGHPFLAPLGRLMRMRHRALRYLVHVHGIDVWTPLSPLRQRALAEAWRVTGSSHFTIDRMLDVQTRRPRSAVVLHPTLDPAFTAASARTKAPMRSDAEPPRLLTVARLARSEAGKGIATILEAMARLSEERPELRATIIGKGDARDDLMARAAELGLGERVAFPGAVSDEELSAAYDAADLFVMPSAKEGFGIVFLEAMAHGLPVLGGDTGGTPEIVEEGVTGRVAPHDDAARLAEVLREMLGDRAALRAMGAAGRRRLEERFTFPHFEERLRGHLTEALDAK